MRRFLVASAVALAFATPARRIGPSGIGLFFWTEF
jgi:hypothetical protein